MYYSHENKGYPEIYSLKVWRDAYPKDCVHLQSLFDVTSDFLLTRATSVLMR